MAKSQATGNFLSLYRWNDKQKTTDILVWGAIANYTSGMSSK